MAKGFEVRETIAAAPAAVWNYLTDFGTAGEWMTGIEDMRPVDDEPLAVGTRLQFKSRGKLRASRVTAIDPGRRIALTSTQGGVTATYTYALEPAGEGTEITLRAVCTATGIWKLLHPVIVIAMRKSDSSHLAKLKSAILSRR